MAVDMRLRIRPYAGTADVAEIVRVYNASAAADNVEEVWTAEGLAAWLSHASEQFDPATQKLEMLQCEVEGLRRRLAELIEERDGNSRKGRGRA